MRGFRIGRLFGIDIRVDYSWLFIFVLMTSNLTSVFMRWHANWSPAETWSVAIAASLLFFVCILLHELAHSLVALRIGVPVRSITLFLFGGVSNIEHDPPSAGREFLMAIVGPLTSIALGVGALAIASAFTTLTVNEARDAWSGIAQLGPVLTLLVWLGPVNIAIGLFNLIPGFPLDGGRVLRSILWGIGGNLRRATIGAALIGRTIGWLFIAAGIAMTFGVNVPLFGTGLASGLWLAFIGWFLQSAATHSTTRLALDDVLAGMTVAQLMQRDAPAVDADETVSALVRDHFLASDGSALAVVQQGALQGLVSPADVQRVPHAQWDTTPARAIMRGRERLEVTAPHEPLALAFERMARANVEQMPVLDQGALVGMLRKRDVTRWLELVWRPHDERPGAPEQPSDTSSRRAAPTH